MTLLKLRPSNVSPPDKFQYLVPEDGWKLQTFAITDLVNQVKDHYTRNGYTIPENLRALIEDQNCQRLSGEWCEYEGGEAFMDGVDTRFGLEEMINGTRVLASFTLGGMKTVSQEEAESRALVCSRCHMNQAVPGCQSCHGLLNIIAEVIGGKVTKEDANLKQCAICKCSNKAQIFVRAEDLAKGTTGQQLRQFRRASHCWKWKAIDALSA